MKITIYYFSGSGNSLYIAKQIAKRFDDSAVLSIALLASKYESYSLTGDVAGIVYPAYFQNAPGIVKSFINGAHELAADYLFSVVTNNGGPGFASMAIENLAAKKGRRIDMSSSITMPGSSVLFGDYTNTYAERTKRLWDSQLSLDAIVSKIEGKRSSPSEIQGGARPKLKGLLAGLAVRIYDLPGKFRTNEKCDECLACVKICPTGAIAYNKRIAWRSNCINCLACYNWCPRSAIEIENAKTNGIRYHHPHVSIREMMIRQVVSPTVDPL